MLNNDLLLRVAANVGRRSERVVVRREPKLSYPSIDQMWEAELNNSETSNAVDPIGSLANWYNKANAFWNVDSLV